MPVFNDYANSKFIIQKNYVVTLALLFCVLDIMSCHCVLFLTPGVSDKRHNNCSLEMHWI